MIWRIEHLNHNILVDIAKLVDKIKEKTFTVEDYILFICDEYPTLGLFGIILQDQLKGYMHASKPHPLDKTTGYITAAIVLPGVARHWVERLIATAEQWMYLHGADQWFAETTRSTRAWQRSWNLGPISKEKTIGRTINV